MTLLVDCRLDICKLTELGLAKCKPVLHQLKVLIGVVHQLAGYRKAHVWERRHNDKLTQTLYQKIAENTVKCQITCPEKQYKYCNNSITIL